MNLNATNQFEAGSVIFEEGENHNCLYMVLKGKVELYGKGFSVVMGAGTLLGVDVTDAYSYGCRAKEPASVFIFQGEKSKQLDSLLASNKDYNGISVFNHARFIYELSRQLNRLVTMAGDLFSKNKEYYSRYLDTIKASNCKASLIPEIVQLEAYPEFETSTAAREQYYSEMARLPYDAVKGFFTPSRYLTTATLHEMIDLEESLIDRCNDVSDYVTDTFMLLTGSEEYSLFRNLVFLGSDMKRKDKDTAPLETMIADCRKVLESVKLLIGSQTGRGWNVNEEQLAKLTEAFAAGSDIRGGAEASEGVDSSIAEMVTSLNDSFTQIVTFGGYPAEEVADFKALLDEYIAMSDRESTDDEYRKLRKSLADHFYELYTRVFVASKVNTKLPKAAELFLDYGFLSEKLLRDDQIVELLSIRKDKTNEPCVVYTMREWLEEVYSGRKEPSRNDMGQDYPEVLRDLKKQGKIDAEQEKALLVDGGKKLDYEIRNVFVHANRVVNGQLSVFVPILHSEQFIGSIEKAYTSADKINETVRALTEIDYSVFYREALYVDPAKVIEREQEMKEVFPIFVLYPTVGQNVIMWQEITGRKRDSEGRFFAPAFAYTALTDMMIKAFGQFRWALCKTIQGTNWNNIQVHSLTADYSDYIQFFKKNRDLSDERKEKIKLQIQRGRNNLREIFTLDYIAWMKSEANGAIKMNKVAREILATFCPFGVSMRNALIKQPLYEEAFARYNRERNKKVHELELRFKALESKEIEIPEALQRTLRFYRDL